jgi:uncharacterized membrane protein (UPF0182 family)
MLGIYHVDDARSFIQRDNAWATPDDPQDPERLQPPYYLTMQMPGQDSPTYSMFTTFIPSSQGNSRNVLTGYLAVDSNAGDQAGVKSPDYGKLRMLVIDSADTVPGPGQVQNTFNSDTNVSSQINILQQGQSQVLNGNLLTLPVGGGLLYVQPVFVQASQGTQLPQLRRVLVAFGDKIAFEDTLNEALDVLFGGDSGATTGDTGVVPTDQETPPDTGGTDTGGSTPTPSPSPSPSEGSSDYQAALEQARQALQDRQSALQSGDFAAFGEADKRLTDAVQRLLELEGQQG